MKSGCRGGRGVLAGSEMKPALKILALAVIAASLAAGCARMPKPDRSTQVLRSHFKRYGKKYPATIYGQSRVKEMDITGQEEIRKHLVAVNSFVTLESGDVQRVHATLEKGPFGWRLLSWELASQ